MRHTEHSTARDTKLVFSEWSRLYVDLVINVQLHLNHGGIQPPLDVATFQLSSNLTCHAEPASVRT